MDLGVAVNQRTLEITGELTERRVREDLDEQVDVEVVENRSSVVDLRRSLHDWCSSKRV